MLHRSVASPSYLNFLAETKRKAPKPEKLQLTFIVDLFQNSVTSLVVYKILNLIYHKV